MLINSNRDGTSTFDERLNGMPKLPQPSQIRSHVLIALARYWPASCVPITTLPLQVIRPQPAISSPLRLQVVAVPHWAADAAVEGKLLVPYEVLPANTQTSADTWRSVDWLLAAFLLLEGWHERLWEHQYGPIHSYSLGLKDWDERVWQRAWVNRIGLFLRQWAIQLSGGICEAQLGPLPEPFIHMTHDVDAVQKTLPIRLKQGAFKLFNAVRAARKGQFIQSAQHIGRATRFFLSWEDWWVFDRLIAVEKFSRVHATWHFYADSRRKSFKRWLLDPGYEIDMPSQRKLIQKLKQEGHQIGLHPAFDTWQSTSLLAAARDRLEHISGSSVLHCRQHWLRFSWKDTWHAQASVGLRQDTTLMFNDRPGYRTSTALAWQPWCPSSRSCHAITVLPTVLMDSHCYDYKPMTTQQRRESIKYWINECKAVRGEIAVLWHPHTLSMDYGWSVGFHELINIIQ